MADEEVKQVEETWVNLSEAAEITGYNSGSLRRLAWSMSQEPEEQQTIKLRKRSNGWEMWLPDLMVYVKRPRPGPILKSKKTNPPIP
jgi:hypothetical protein